MLSVEMIKEIAAEAHNAAYIAAVEYCDKYMNGYDGGAYGFAWVNLYEYEGVRLKGNTKAGRALKAAGIEQDWNKIFIIWNPARYPAQSVDVLEAGARAAAEVWRNYGFDAHANSRLD
jgi:hypothetical protein